MVFFMTRINISVPPEELIMQHLIAEHREMIRIPNTVKSGKAKLVGIPTQFTLGTGHVKFFYDKLLFLKNRYEAVYQECRKRGYNVQYYGSAWDGVPAHLMNDYHPTEKDDDIIRERINSKLKAKGLL